MIYYGTKKFTLKPLPYAYDALEPYIDERTVTIHHDKHQKTYVDNLNKTLEGHEKLQSKSLEDILKHIDKVPKEIRQAVINNGGWSILTMNFIGIQWVQIKVENLLEN